MEARVHALKVTEDAGTAYASLREGEGRFGWSYVETADLVKLSERVSTRGWDDLSDDEQKCYQKFLLSFRPGDWVIYVNMPTWGRCCAAKVSAPYYWRWEGGDFNHRFGVERDSLLEFDRNDAMVHPALSARLKLAGRHWRITTEQEFMALVESLRRGEGGSLATADDGLMRLTEEVGPTLLDFTRKVHHTHPNTKLEALLTRVFEQMPGVIEVEPQGGPADQGADILVTIERAHPLTGRTDRSVCAVQVKSFEGEHASLRAINDLYRAFEAYPEVSSGLIVSTADRATPQFEQAMEKLRESSGKKVDLLIGKDLALFLIKHASDLWLR